MTHYFYSILPPAYDNLKMIDISSSSYNLTFTVLLLFFVMYSPSVANILK
ncbi:unnamed protein product [Moritella viscosa]|uniref:Uncharacterized protein n=1 Tax=Moritella viscosa TaxID=80854 RepID=A0A1L0ALD4_9GAMM|nr:unnamed protein product [Moritella viscosa]SGZ19078.1 unnamed protein product [Moritella viscosa]SHN99016.1 unnamed protein product [Moritella viscosa]SHN99019.1 unnamed protein product [Moritella viscosa]SHO01162.1 unnamed protein product [Moritella viscosa]